jgi:cytoplasmic iron level regulating protein YaaA (DUF328/UPF0246 family)
MIVVLSPSKSMDMEPAGLTESTEPAFLERSEKLASKLRGFSKAKMMEFMEISEQLAELNRKRFRDWQPPFTLDNAKQAVLAFTGDVYDGLDASSLKKRDLQYAQNHLRILSGLYGLLRPLDLIQPYRLEMGRALKTRGTENLYAFWRESITHALNAETGSLLVNLASQEYFKAVDTGVLKKSVISPVFKDEKNGKYKIISFFAKKARGSMARYLIEKRVKDADELLGFAEDGYRYNPALSKEHQPVFTRPEA